MSTKDKEGGCKDEYIEYIQSMCQCATLESTEIRKH